MSLARTLPTVGLIGGLSWESTQHYYRLLNEGVRDWLGPTVSAPILLQSFNFAEIEALQHAGEWDALDALMADAAIRLSNAGADFLLICSNSMHRCAPAISAAAAAPLLHIADPVTDRASHHGWSKLALLGTRFTMEGDFLKGRLQRHHDIIVPNEAERQSVHDTIYHELVAGIVNPESREKFVRLIDRLHDRGADAVILGCTEIMMLISADDTSVPLIDTTSEHAAAAIARLIGVNGSDRIDADTQCSMRRLPTR